MQGLFATLFANAPMLLIMFNHFHPFVDSLIALCVSEQDVHTLRLFVFKSPFNFLA